MVERYIIDIAIGFILGAIVFKAIPFVWRVFNNWRCSRRQPNV
jgi:hypothetical protein